MLKCFHVFFLSMYFIFVIGCKSTMRFSFETYTPTHEKIESKQEAIDIIKRTLEEQPIDSAPSFVEVDTHKFRVIFGSFNFASGASRTTGISIYFDRFDKLDLYQHRRTNKYMVAICINGNICYRVYTYAKEDAARFIDAMSFMASTS